MFPSNICKDIWNTFWPSLSSWVIIDLSENGFKNNGREIALTEDTQIIFGAYIDVISYVKGYHVYKNV